MIMNKVSFFLEQDSEYQVGERKMAPYCLLFKLTISTI